MTEKQGVWRGTTAEERVVPRRRKLVQAGFELLGEHGVAGTTVRGVCARAHLNPRYFYESFDDIDALFGAVFDSILSETTELTLAAIAAAPDTAEAKTRAALEASIRHIVDDPRRVRIVFGETADNVLGHKRAEVVKASARMMADLAASFYGIDRDDKLLISSTFMLTGGLTELVLAWSHGSIDLTLDELIDHATMLTVGTSQAAGSLVKKRS